MQLLRTHCQYPYYNCEYLNYDCYRRTNIHSFDFPNRNCCCGVTAAAAAAGATAADDDCGGGGCGCGDGGYDDVDDGCVFPSSTSSSSPMIR